MCGLIAPVRGPTTVNVASGHSIGRNSAPGLSELGVQNHLSERVLNDLGQSFKLSELEEALSRRADSDDMAAIRFETERAIHWLATSNYEVSFSEAPLGERVLSPAGPAESRGMEDARFVRFSEEDGSTNYYATYTAFDGFEVLPQLIETADFTTFKISTLSGVCARGKGMALFPRRIGGDFVALARTDNESTFLLRSDSVLRWDVAELVLAPTEPWEIVQGGKLRLPDGDGGRMVGADARRRPDAPVRACRRSSSTWTSRPRSSDGFPNHCSSRRLGSGMGTSPTWCTPAAG